MSKSIFSAVLITGLALGLSSFARAADRDWVHYNEFLKRVYLDRFYASPATDRDALVAKINVRSDDKFTPEIKVPTATGTIVLRPDEEGVTEFPYSEALVKADPMLLISAPAGMKFKTGINLQPNVTLKESYSIAELARPIDQANALLKSQAGMWSFAIPKSKRFMLRFPAGSSAAVTVVDAVLKPDKAGMVFVEITDALRKSNPTIVCSQRPLAVDID